MPAYGALDVAVPGQLINGEDFIDSLVVADADGIAFGAPVFVANGEDGKAFPAKTDALSFVLSAAFVTANTIAGTVNGTAYSVNFDTDDATTFAALVTALNALPGTIAVGDFAIRTITITNTATGAASASGTVTGGASQATVTVTTSANVSLLGVAVFSHREYAGASLAKYQTSLSVVRVGRIWVKTGPVVLSGQRAYWDATNKVFTNVSSGNVATPWYFRTTTAAASSVAILDVTKPVAATGA